MILPGEHKVICYGEALWDVFSDGSIPGGAPLNVAIHLKNLGYYAEIVSKVGNDKEGEDLLRFISTNKLSVNYISKDNHYPTGKVIVSLDNKGKATYEICNPSAWDYIELNQEIQKLSLEANMIIYGTLSSRNPVSRDTLHGLLQSKAIKIIDVNLRPPYNNRDVIEPLLHKANIIKLNDDELVEIASWHGITMPENNAIEWLCNFYDCSMVLLTLGERGAILYSNGTSYKHDGFKIKAIDTVGSGDSFLAAAIASIIEKETVENVLDFACATGSFVATKKGATPGINRNEIQRFKDAIL